MASTSLQNRVSPSVRGSALRGAWAPKFISDSKTKLNKSPPILSSSALNRPQCLFPETTCSQWSCATLITSRGTENGRSSEWLSRSLSPSKEHKVISTFLTRHEDPYAVLIAQCHHSDNVPGQKVRVSHRQYPRLEETREVTPNFLKHVFTCKDGRPLRRGLSSFNGQLLS